METNFFDRVYAVAAQIPYGKVTNYGAIARFIGAPKSARMVGYAMNTSGTMPDIPAHRVVNRNGLLTGKHHFGGTRGMADLLISEGIQVRDNQIQDFEKVYWDPNEELDRNDFMI